MTALYHASMTYDPTFLGVFRPILQFTKFENLKKKLTNQIQQFEYTMNTAEIRLLILRTSPLDTLVALNETCQDWRSFLSFQDSSLVKKKVLQRVPWMELAPEVCLRSWMDCARLIVARKRSFQEESDKWWVFNQGKRAFLENYSLTQLSRNTDIRYLPCDNIDGGTLPGSFEPLFESSTALVQGKYFKSPRGKILDMTRVKIVDGFVGNKDEGGSAKTRFWTVKVTRAVSGYYTITCPTSGLTIESQRPFRIEQEGHNILVIETEQNEKGVFIVQNPFQNSSTFLFDCEDSKCVFFPGYKSSYRLTLTPDGRGVICISNLPLGHLGTSHVEIYYYEVSRDCRNPVLLAHFSRPNNEEITTVVFFAGMMFLNVSDSALVPLWIDLQGLEQEQSAFWGNRYTWSALSIQPRHSSYASYTMSQIIRSTDKRWATNWYGRQVCDLWSFRTFIVKDSGAQSSPDCTLTDSLHSMAATCFIAKKDSETPSFYTISRPVLETLDSFLYGKRSRENGFPSGLVNTDPTRFWKKVLEESHRNPHVAMALFGDERRLLVIDQNETSDRLEDPVGLGWFDQWG